MSTAKTRKPRPSRLLDGFPPDTRIVAAGVTWDDYENLVNQVGNARNCRIAFDGKDIEMISPPKIDRPGIYAALQVPEFWRVRNKAVSIEQLGPDGTYAPVPRSRFLRVQAEDVTRWVFSEVSSSLVTWEGRLREWVRVELGPRVNG